VKRLGTPLLALVIFLLNVCLNAPLFMPGELPFRGSIEGGYVAIARFVSAHPNPWGWTRSYTAASPPASCMCPRCPTSPHSSGTSCRTSRWASSTASWCRP